MYNGPMEAGFEDRKDVEPLSLKPEDIQTLNAYIAKHPESLLEVSAIRRMIAHNRLQRTSKEDIKTMNNHDAAVIKNAIEHNVQGLEGGVALGRPDFLVRVLQSIEFAALNASQLKVLSVGPRSEAEIMALFAAGFAPKNVRGLDLISYSPYVDLGDMHEMPYGDGIFDIVILGWVLAYSKDNPKVAREVLRVCKPGALVAVGCEYNPKTSEQLKAESGESYVLEDDYPRFTHTDEILKLFEGSIDSVIFRHDIWESMKAQPGGIMTVFRLKS